mmetsp:Transcript_147169/g.208727  ORF Transcript_147169/g.208727 Transcript_147169/m.208727 type:complete len:203 (-) Transcript_147169:1446-2054(-)
MSAGDVLPLQLQDGCRVVGGSRRVSRKSRPCKLPFDVVHFDRTRTGIPIGQMEQRQCCFELLLEWLGCDFGSTSGPARLRIHLPGGRSALCRGFGCVLTTPLCPEAEPCSRRRRLHRSTGGGGGGSLLHRRKFGCGAAEPRLCRDRTVDQGVRCAISRLSRALGPEKAAGRAGRTANSGRHSTAPVRGMQDARLPGGGDLWR